MDELPLNGSFVQFLHVFVCLLLCNPFGMYGLPFDDSPEKQKSRETHGGSGFCRYVISCQVMECNVM